MLYYQKVLPFSRFAEDPSGRLVVTRMRCGTLQLPVADLVQKLVITALLHRLQTEFASY